MKSWSRASNNNNSLQINRSYSPQASKSTASNAKSLSSFTENKSYSHNDDEVEDEVDVENQSEQNEDEEDEYDWSDEEFTFEGASLLDEEDNDKVTTFTAATRLLEKRKEMMDVHGALKAKKEEYHIRLKAIKEKERQLGKKRNDLTDNIIELDKFIGVCA